MNKAMVISAALLLMSQVGEGEMEVNPFIALAIVWFLLGFMNPEIATPFAWLIAIGLLFARNKGLVKSLNFINGKGKAKKA